MATLTLNPTISATGNAVFRGTTTAVDGTTTIITDPSGNAYHGRNAGGVFNIPSNEAEFSIAPTIITESSELIDDENYLYDPNRFKLQAADTWMHVYWKGGDHTDNDGAIYGKISTDNMLTWGAEQLLVDDASGYDTRNIGGGVNPATGEIILFYRVYDASLAINVDTKRIVGSADASTWGTPVSVSSWFGQAVSPFDNIVWGANGALMVFHLGSANAAWVVKSTDAFVTADVVTTVTGADEAWIVPIDDDRAVMVSRDNTNLNSQRFIKTSDWGDTWTALSSPYPFVDTNWTANIGDGVLIDGAYVLQLWTERGPAYDVYASYMDKETFWANPQYGWSQDLTENPTRTLVYDGPDPGATYGLNFGSPKLAVVEGHEYAPVMFVYQPAVSPATTADEGKYVEIAYMTLPRF